MWCEYPLGQGRDRRFESGRDRLSGAKVECVSVRFEKALHVVDRTIENHVDVVVARLPRIDEQARAEIFEDRRALIAEPPTRRERTSTAGFTLPSAAEDELMSRALLAEVPPMCWTEPEVPGT